MKYYDIIKRVRLHYLKIITKQLNKQQLLTIPWDFSSNIRDCDCREEIQT